MRRLELRGIRKSYGGVRALKGVDITVEAGQTLVLLGENGAGKSTLIKTLTGAIRPDAGEIRLDGTPVTFRNPVHARSLGITAVYQEPMIFRHLTVLENIFAGAELTDRAGRILPHRMLDAVRPWLGPLDLAEAMLHRPMGELGLGHQQLALIAQALVQDARIIVFDEPTSILSRAETDRLVGIIHALRTNGRGIVYITHRLEEVPRLGDHVTVLTDGEVTGNYPAAEITEAKLLQLMMGKTPDALAKEERDARTHQVAHPPVVLAVEHLSHARHFRDVGWQVPGATVTGIYGLVGAGRSEVALALFGALAPNAGRIVLNGAEIRPRSPAEAMALGIGYLPEDRKRQGIFSPLSIESNLTCNVLPAYQRAGWALDLGRLRADARRIMARFAIKAPDAATAIGSLSGGNQQKALFARWAGRDLRVLILDEPTRGIDLATKEEIHAFIRGLARDGLAVVVISSDLAELMTVAARVIVMRHGRVVDTLEADALSADRVLAAAIGAGDPRAHAA